MHIHVYILNKCAIQTTEGPVGGDISKAFFQMFWAKSRQTTAEMAPRTHSCLQERTWSTLLKSLAGRNRRVLNCTGSGMIWLKLFGSSLLVEPHHRVKPHQPPNLFPPTSTRLLITSYHPPPTSYPVPTTLHKLTPQL
jgi:hypothetical protein